MKSFSSFFLLFLFSLCSFELQANARDQHRVDSVKLLLSQTSDIQSQVSLHAELCQLEVRNQNFDEAIEHVKKAEELARLHEETIDLSKALYKIGTVYKGDLDNFDKALDFHQESMDLALENEDQAMVVNNLAGILGCYRFKDDQPKIIEYAQRTLDLATQLGDKKNIAVAYMAFGHLHDRVHEDDIALKYFKDALAINKELDDPSAIMASYTWIASIYSTRKDFDKVLSYYDELLAMSKKYDSKSMKSVANFGIALYVKLAQGKLDEALHYLALAEETANNSYRSAVWKQRAGIFIKQGNYLSAKKLLEKCIPYHLTTKEVAHLMADYQTLSIVNEKMGDYQSALTNHKIYMDYKDSVARMDASKVLMRYEFDKKETALLVKQQVEIARKNTIAKVTYGVFGVFILIGGMGSYNYWQRNKRLQLEKKYLHMRRREAELAKDTEAFKVQFLSNISHEFRTPLTLINGHLEILQKEGDVRYMKRFKEMEYSSNRLLQLISQLLDLAKIETGEYSLYYKKGNLLNEVQHYVESFHSFALEREIKLISTVTFAAKVKFSHRDFIYSSEAIASIFNNLLSNALKFTPANGTVHTIVDYLGGKLYFSVRDTGPGIPEEDLDSIFDRFYQSKQGDQPIYEGAGVGLAIVKELAHYHNGGVEVVNNADVGCTFSVWVGEGELSSELEGSPEFTSVNVGRDFDTLQNDLAFAPDNPLVLVVEDQKELRRFIVENLGSEYTILQAKDGRQGIEIAQEMLPDIIISDVMMPETTGIELTNVLKTSELTSHIPIVLLTAKAQLEDKIEGLACGADEYLTKPFSIAELQLRVKNRLAQQEKLRRRFQDDPSLLKQEDEQNLNLIDRQFVEKLEQIVLNDIETNIDVNTLATEIGLSSSQLTRKLKVLMGLTPANFMRNLRIRVAHDLLLDGYTVSEASWKVGFEDAAYFSKVFKKQHGFLPSEVKKQC